MGPDPASRDGIVVEINIAPRNEQLPEPVERVRAVPAHGLEGDRYFASERREEAERDRDLTLIAAEALEALTEETGIELTAAASRRNVLTRGIDLNGLVGRAFRVGAVECEGLELCEPCSHLQGLTEPGVLRGLVHRGGLRAAIRREGEIVVGDSVSPSSPGPTRMDLRSLIHEVPDFPRPGISFKDATPLMANPEAFSELLSRLAEAVGAEVGDGRRITHVVAPEARGFIFGAALANAIGAGFVPARKPGRLPRPTRSADYELEYGTDQLHAHLDAFGAGDRVVVCDDLIATGGTAAAVAEIVVASGADLVAFAFAIELASLGGREALARFGAPILSVIELEA